MKTTVTTFAELKHWARAFRDGDLQLLLMVRPDCCILATAALIDVFDYFKLTAKPLSVISTVFNPRMADRIALEGMPTPEEAERSWFPPHDTCRSLAVGAGDPEPGKWPGHLVCVLDGKVLIDLTLDQADRPHRGIELPVPVIAPVNEEFLAGQGELVGMVNGCRVVYLARPEDRTFERSRDQSVPRCV
jgi:hypothetical protein